MNSSLITKIVIVFLLNTLFLGADEKGDERTRITLVRLDIGWTITVDKDGSGSVSYGSAIFDSATFQEGTVDFTKLLRSLEEAPVAEKNKDEGEIIHVMVKSSEKGKVATGKKALKSWVKICREIEPKLESRKPEHFNKLKNDRPLLKAKEKNQFIEDAD